MKGHLKLMVLHLLKDKDMSGYQLMSEIGAFLGKKPSPGSIYPILGELYNDKFISMKEEERKKTYSLTKEGMNKISEFTEHKQEFFEKVAMMHKFFSDVCHVDTTECDNLLNVIKKQEMHNIGFTLLRPDMLNFMRILLKKSSDKKNIPRIKTALKNAANELKNI